MLWNFHFLTLGEPYEVTCQVGEIRPFPSDSSPSCEFRAISCRKAPEAKTVNVPLGKRPNTWESNAVPVFYLDCKRKRWLGDVIGSFLLNFRCIACISFCPFHSVPLHTRTRTLNVFLAGHFIPLLSRHFSKTQQLSAFIWFRLHQS